MLVLRHLPVAAAGAALVALVPVASGTEGFPDAASAAAAARAAAYLAGAQGEDGSVPTGWRPDQVAEAVIALAAGGGQDTTIRHAVGFLEETATSGAANGPFAGRIVSGLVAAGQDPRQFAGTDFVARLQSFYDPVTGGYGGNNLYADSLAMLGVLAARADLPDGAVARLTLNQCAGGGWSYQVGCLGRPDADTTSMAMSVLAAVLGTGAPEVRGARSWLLGAQNPSGCWGLEPGDPDNANSCGLGLSAIVALGEHPGRSPWASEGHDPPGALRGLQLASGAFRYRGDVPRPNDYATVQAVPGLAGRSYPVVPPEAAPGAGGGSPDRDLRTAGSEGDPGHEPTVAGTGPLAEEAPRHEPAEVAPLPGGSAAEDAGWPASARPDPTPRDVTVPAGVALALLAPVAAGTGWWWRRATKRGAGSAEP